MQCKTTDELMNMRMDALEGMQKSDRANIQRMREEMYRKYDKRMNRIEALNEDLLREVDMTKRQLVVLALIDILLFAIIMFILLWR